MADRQGATTARPPPEPLRHRPLARASTMAEPPSASSSTRRRSSFLTSDSFDRASFRSSTDSLLLPRPSRQRTFTEQTPIETEESSHMHSLPLALALLPAVGGLLFKNGSAVLTDATLLVLAAIFLNWSVRLPWDWYHSAQSIRVQEELEAAEEAAAAAAAEETVRADGEEESGYFSRTTSRSAIIEETDNKDDEDGADSPVLSPPPPPLRSSPQPISQTKPTPPSPASSAASELRMHELAALCACFAFPLAGAWLLHHIRAQLSRPSEGLVSDYNLSIFLLAAELRPLSHLLRLVQARTLHLQRIVATHPITSEKQAPSPQASRIADLQTRLDELEAHVASGGGASNGSPEKERQLIATAAPQIEASLRRALQPDIDAVTRATRRYEKRAALLAAQTDGRLAALEARVTDALSLAAGAERRAAQESNRPGPVRRLVTAFANGAAALGEAALFVLGLPLRLAEWAAASISAWTTWALANSIGKLVDLRRFGLVQRDPIKTQPHRREGTRRKLPITNGRRPSPERASWKGREQSVDGNGFGAERFGARKSAKQNGATRARAVP